MTEKQRERIQRYIPSPRDETLAFGEYYYLQSTARGDRVIRVQAKYIMPGKDGTEYGIFMNGRRIDAGYGDPFRGVRKSELYDNKNDCRYQSHMMFDDWESLRELQKEAEANE